MSRLVRPYLSSLLNHVRLYTLHDAKPIIKQGNIIDVSPEVAKALTHKGIVEECRCGPDDDSREELMYWLKSDYEFAHVKKEAIYLNDELMVVVIDRILAKEWALHKTIDAITDLVVRHNVHFDGSNSPTIVKRLAMFKKRPRHLKDLGALIAKYLHTEVTITRKTMTVRGTKGNVMVAAKFFSIVRHQISSPQDLKKLETVMAQAFNTVQEELKKGRVTNVA